MNLEELKNILSKDYEEDIVKQIIEGMQVKRYVTLRINTLKTTKDKVLEILDRNKIKYEEITWYQDALIILNEREDKIRSLDIYEKGEIYLQSLSSMIPVLVLNPKEGENILDMTAAPGGKTTQIAALGNNKVMITAVEKNKIRLERLKYNIEKLGVRKVNVLKADAQNLDEAFLFDKILLDAPCSGSGTLEIKDGKVTNEFSLELIDRSVAIQKKLLRKALKMLKVGGELVYATCSILKAENEENIVELINDGNVEVVAVDNYIYEKVPKLSCKIDGALVIKPDEFYEGFFVVNLRKIK